MEGEGIGDIIAAEKEIQKRIEEEKIKIEQWIEEMKKKAEEEISRAEEEGRRDYEKRLSAFEEMIRNDASRIINEAIRWQEFTANLSDDELRSILLGFIIKIIPDHDSFQGQGRYQG